MTMTGIVSVRFVMVVAIAEPTPSSDPGTPSNTVFGPRSDGSRRGAVRVAKWDGAAWSALGGIVDDATSTTTFGS